MLAELDYFISMANLMINHDGTMVRPTFTNKKVIYFRGGENPLLKNGKSNNYYF